MGALVAGGGTCGHNTTNKMGSNEASRFRTHDLPLAYAGHPYVWRRPLCH